MSLSKDTEKFEVDMSHDVHELDRIPSYLKKTDKEKILKGHVATMIVLLFVFTDVVAVFGAIMIDSVCYAYGKSVYAFLSLIFYFHV